MQEIFHQRLPKQGWNAMRKSSSSKSYKGVRIFIRKRSLDENPIGPLRLGIAVTSSWSKKAHERNRIKRQLRARPWNFPGFDIGIIISKNSPIEKEKLEQVIEHLFDQMGMYVKNPPSNINLDDGWKPLGGGRSSKTYLKDDIVLKTPGSFFYATKEATILKLFKDLGINDIDINQQGAWLFLPLKKNTNEITDENQFIERFSLGVQKLYHMIDVYNKQDDSFGNRIKEIFSLDEVKRRRLTELKKRTTLVCSNEKFQGNDLLGAYSMTEKIIEYLFTQLEQSFDRCLMHGDYRLANVLYDNHELILIDPQGYRGDPTYDLLQWYLSNLLDWVERKTDRDIKYIEKDYLRSLIISGSALFNKCLIFEEDKFSSERFRLWMLYIILDGWISHLWNPIDNTEGLETWTILWELWDGNTLMNKISLIED